LKLTVIESLRARLREQFLLRWTLANLAGWTVGLLVGAWSSVTPLLCLGGLLAGFTVGLAQWWALREALPVRREWIGWTLAGAAAGLLGAAFAALLALFNWNIGVALAGAALGAGVGTAQSLLLSRLLSRTGWWIAANAGAGALCALLTLIPLIRGLPLGLVAGAALYGWITGRVLVWLAGQDVEAAQKLDKID
jgi:hypothetical protein